MRTLIPLLLLASSAFAAERPVAIAIHGGAGTIERGSMTDAQEAAIRKDLENALDAGHAVLARGGDALDAVTAVVTRL